MAVLREFKTKAFARWSRKADVPDDALCTAVQELVAELIDADLGGHVHKKRVAVSGRGKSDGARVIIGTRELAALQMLAQALLSVETKALEQAVKSGELLEICREEESTAR